MADEVGIGTIRAVVEVDSKTADASLKEVAKTFDQVGNSAQQSGQKIAASAEMTARAQKLQEAAIARQIAGMEKWALSVDKNAAAQKRLQQAQELVTAVQSKGAANSEQLTRAMAIQAAAAGNLAKVQSSVGSATEHSIPQMSAASAAVRALEGNMTHNIRAAERFVSTTLGLAPLLEKAFPVVGAVALGAAVVGVVSELISFGKTAEDLAQDLGTNWLQAAIDEVVGMGKEIRALDDDIQKTNQHIGATIQKLKESSVEDARSLFGPMAGATVSASLLETQIHGNERTITNLQKLLAIQQQMANVSGVGSGPIRPGQFEADQAARKAAKGAGVSTDPDEARRQAESTAKSIRDLQLVNIDLQQQVTKGIREGAKDEGAANQQNVDARDRAAKQALAQQRAAEQELIRQWERDFRTREAQGKLTAQQELNFWIEREGKVKQGSAAYLAAVDKANDVRIASAAKTSEALAAIRKKAVDFVKSSGTNAGPAGITLSSGGTLGLFSTGNEALLAAQTKAAQAQAAINAEWQATVDKIGLVTGKVTPLTAAMDEQARHTEEYRLQLVALREQLEELQSGDALAATLGGDPALAAKELQVRTQIAELEGKARSQALIDQQATLSQTWTGMIDNVWDEMIRKANDTTNQIRAIASQFIDGINSELAKGITGGKTDFSSVFHSAAEGLAKTGLEKLEGSLLKGFGLGSKADGTQGNPFHVVVDNGSGISSGLAGLFGGKGANVTGPPGTDGLVRGVGGGLLGAMNDSNWLSSLFGGKLFGSGSFFGNLGHFAAGGPIPSNMPAIVGERGPELFMPSTAGRIVPNHQLGSVGGGQMVMNIDARGTDPSLTRANFEQSLRAVHAASVTQATHAIAERSRRRPRG